MPARTNSPAAVVDDPLAAKGLLKPTKRLPSNDPQNIEGLAMPYRAVGPRKKTELEKRLRDERDERKNWLLLAPGQLTGKYSRRQEFHSAKDEDLEQTEEDDDRPRDYTFYGLGQSKNLRLGENQKEPQNPQKGWPATQRGNQFTAASTDTPDRKKSPSGPAARRDDQGQELGLHTAGELDLKDYLDISQANIRADDLGDPLRSFLGANAAPVRTPERQARLDEYRGFLNNPGGASRAGAPAESIRLPSELAGPPTTPALRLPDTAPRSGSGNLFGSSPSAEPPSTSRSGPLASSLSDWNAPRPATPTRNLPAPPGYGSFGQQPPARPSILRPTVLEIPQRQR